MNERNRAQIEAALHDAVDLEAGLRAMSERLNRLTDHLLIASAEQGGVGDGASDPTDAA